MNARATPARAGRPTAATHLLATLGCLVALGLALPVSAAGVAREQRPVANIERVVLRAIGDLEVTQGTRESLVIEAERALLPRISSHVKNGVLTFDIPGGEFATRHPVRYRLTVKNLKAIDTQGSGDIVARQLRSPTLDLNLAGSGNASVHALDTRQLRVRMISSADVSVDGHATRQTVSIEGSGDYDASRLPSDQATVAISGAGNAVVRVKNHLRARITGSGEIRYHGKPTLDGAVTGAGEILRADSGN